MEHRPPGEWRRARASTPRRARPRVSSAQSTVETSARNPSHFTSNDQPAPVGIGPERSNNHSPNVVLVGLQAMPGFSPIDVRKARPSCPAWPQFCVCVNPSSSGTGFPST